MEVFLFDVTLLPFKRPREKKEGIQPGILMPDTHKEEEEKKAREATRVREAVSDFKFCASHSESSDAEGQPRAPGLHPVRCSQSLSRCLSAA